ncbi:hypothetical protein A9Q84_08515 [Halobacteriovorax marinus]|uniref:Uncharacterized protein n=1 Tax=Halobacteriovorax marinus TaxID=97084 RepID=A0A1Y5F6M4_9BACT|nr:hypothetical protein A9Q84_08515 [Halobacteriovorax marinus]
MLNHIRKVTLITISFFSLLFTPCAFAQSENSTDILEESLGDITTVAAMGIGGAILGLSTLSFVEEPKDHLKNVLVGGAMGVILGVGFVAWQQATKSKGSYEDQALKVTPNFGTTQRVAWQQTEIKKVFMSQTKSISNFSYSFSF